MRMNRVFTGALAATLALGFAAPATMAQQPRQQAPQSQSCPQDKACVKKVDAKSQKTAQQTKTAEKRSAPHVGDSARNAPMLQQAKNSRLPTPPKNQHYRVVDDRVVRVDDGTRKIVAVIGLVSEILK